MHVVLLLKHRTVLSEQSKLRWTDTQRSYSQHEMSTVSPLTVHRRAWPHSNRSNDIYRAAHVGGYKIVSGNGLQDSAVWAEKMHPQRERWQWRIRTTAKNVMKSILSLNKSRKQTWRMMAITWKKKKKTADIWGHFCCSIRRMKDCLIQGSSSLRLKNISRTY